MNNLGMFHLAIPINDIIAAKRFYTNGLGCLVGRENDKAIIFDFFGHQLVAHTTDDPLVPQKGIYPRHFGINFSEKSTWNTLVQRIQQQQIPFYIEPKLRFEEQITEHWSFFIADPFHNLLEFKYYTHPDAILGAKEMANIGDR